MEMLEKGVSVDPTSVVSAPHARETCGCGLKGAGKSGPTNAHTPPLPTK